MALSKKIGFTLGILAMAVLLIGVYTEKQLDLVRRQTRQARDSWGELGPALRLSQALWDFQREMTAIAAEPQPGDTPAFLEATMDRIDASLEELAEAVEQGESSGPLEMAHLDQLRELRVQLLRDAQAASQAATQTERAERLARVLEGLERMRGTLSGAIAGAESRMREAVRRLGAIEEEVDAAMWAWWIGFLFLVGTLWFTLTRLLLRPVHALSGGVEALRRGVFSHRVPVMSRDELGAVAEAFNTMAADLESLYHSLEEKVADQTREIRRTCAELERSQKLASIGTLAAGVAHEINNPLEAMTLCVDGLRRRVDGGDLPREALREAIEQIQTDIARCRTITSQMLEFSRQRPARASAGREVVDIAPLLESAAEFLPLRGRESPRRIRCQVATRPLPVLGDPHLLRQVFLNLLFNAVEATDAEGEITISATADDDVIRVTFADNGVGIDRCDMPHLFEPFYTTKSGAQNVGLGLSVVHGIVTDHGGSITVSSPGPGRGATFLLTLPRAPAPLTA